MSDPKPWQNPISIARGLKRYYEGDLLGAARYADQISFGASMNPWADSWDAPNYAGAAKMLRTEHEDNERQKAIDRCCP